jgi:WD domain, G-beta repeat
VRVWDRASGSLIVGFGDGNVSALAFDDEGSRLAIGRAHGDITIVSSAVGGSIASPIRSVSGHWWRTDWVTFLRDEQRLASIGNGGLLTVHGIGANVEASVPRQSLRLEQRSLDLGFRGALSPDRSLIAASSHENVLLLDAETLQERGRLVGKGGRIYALAFSPDGRRLLTSGAGLVVRVWDLGRRELLAELVAHTDVVYALAYSPDGQRIASGGADRLVRIWDAETFEELGRLEGHTSYVYSLAFSQDGRCLLSGGGDATVRMWDTRPFRELVAARPPR